MKRAHQWTTIVLLSCFWTATHSFFVPSCCTRQTLSDCPSSHICPLIDDSSTLIRIPLWENASVPSPLRRPLDVSNIQVNLKWANNSNPQEISSIPNSKLQLHYMPSSTWLVLAVGSRIHPISGSFLLAEIRSLRPQKKIVEWTIIGSRSDQDTSEYRKRFISDTKLHSELKGTEAVANWSVMASSGRQTTAILLNQAFNVTVSSTANDLPANITGISSFLVTTGTRSFDCRSSSTFFDSPTVAIRCLIPANTMLRTRNIGVNITLSDGQTLSTSLNFSIVNAPSLDSSLAKRIAINAAQLKLTGTFLGSEAAELAGIIVGGSPCLAPLIWTSPTEVLCNLNTANLFTLGETVTAQVTLYNGDLSTSTVAVGVVVDPPPEIVESTRTFIPAWTNLVLQVGGNFSLWSSADITLLRFIWGGNNAFDCTSRARIFNGMLTCNVTEPLEVLRADGNLIRAFAIIGGAAVGPTAIAYVASGIPVLTRVTALAVVTPWNRAFIVPGLNFCRFNVTFNTAILTIGDSEYTCEGTLVTTSVLRCNLPVGTPLPLPLGDVIVTRVISNGISSGPVRVRVAYVSVPPGLGVGPAFAPDGTPLSNGFGTLSSTILVIIVLSGLIVLVLMTFMILSGRTGGHPRAARADFSTRAVATVIAMINGPIPEKYQSLLPSSEDGNGTADTDTETSSSGSSSASAVFMYEEDEENLSSSSSSVVEVKTKTRKSYKKKTKTATKEKKKEKQQQQVIEASEESEETVDLERKSHKETKNKVDDSNDLESLNSESESDSVSDSTHDDSASESESTST